MMKTRAVVVKKDENGKRVYELRESFECPPLDEYSIAVKVKACGLSSHNSKILEEFNLVGRKEHPFGWEISGIVTNVGSAVTRVSIGDEVAGLLPLDSASSGCANFCVLSQYDVASKPEKVDHIDAAGCIGDVIKAYTALHYQARVCGGETILIFNGASSSGVMAIQLAHIWGVKVLATASSEEEVIYLQGLQPPVANVIDLRKTKKSLVDICMDETGGLGVDCVLDNGVLHQDESVKTQGEISVTGTNPLPSKHDVICCLAVAGRWITSLQDLQLDPPDSQILSLKGASVSFLFEHSWALSRGQQGRYLHILSPGNHIPHGVLFDSHRHHGVHKYKAYVPHSVCIQGFLYLKLDILCDIMDKLSNSVIRPVIHHTVSLEDACDTLQQLSQHAVGKIVVRM